MDVTKCEAFLAAIDYESLTAADVFLGYAQSGITRMINVPEEEVGFPFFIRTEKGVSPTGNGKAMTPAFREIVRAHNHALEVGADIRDILSGALTIGSYYSVPAMWLPPILKRFRQLYPNVRINMEEGGNREMARRLNEMSVGCCFFAEPTAGTICDWIPICQDELLIWLPKNHPGVGEASFPLCAPESEPFIIIMLNQDMEIDRLLRSRHLTPDIRFSTADAYTTYCMVEAGLGISLNNRLITLSWSGDVVTLPFDPPQFVSLGIGVPSWKEASPVMKKFIECVKDMLEELP